MNREQKRTSYERYLEAKGLEVPSREEIHAQAMRIAERIKAPIFRRPGVIVLGEHPETAEEVYLDPNHMLLGLQVIGRSGYGKSWDFRNLFDELLELREKTGEGIAIIDPHGTLAEYCLNSCARRGLGFAEQVVYFDLKYESRIPVFNPLHFDPPEDLKREMLFKVACGFTEATTKVSGSESTTDKPLTSQVICNTAGVLLFNGLTPVESRYFVQNTKDNLRVRKQLLTKVTDPLLRDFWEEIQHADRETQNFYTQAAERRFKHLLQIPALERVMGQTGPGLDLKKLMDDGGIAIFNLAMQGTGLTHESQRLIGALLIQDFRRAVEDRKPDVSRPFTLIIDEFGEFVTADVAKIFWGARKFGLRTAIGHQNFSQLIKQDQDLRLHDAALGIPNKMVLRPETLKDAQLLSGEMYAQFVDTELPLRENWLKSYKPIPEKVQLRSLSRSWDRSTQGGGSRGTGMTTLPSGDVSESVQDTVNWGWAMRYGNGEQLGEAYVTRYQEELQLSSVQFKSVADQLFEHAQELLRLQRGVHRLVVENGEPQPFRGRARPTNPDPKCTAFLHEIWRRLGWGTAKEVDHRIAERTAHLLKISGGERSLPRFAPKTKRS